MQRISAALLFLALLWALATTLLTASLLFVARGSDAGVELYTASLLTKLLTLLAASAVWTTSAIRWRLPLWSRWSLRALGLLALGLSTHLVVFNNRRAVLEEHWFLVRLDRASYDPADGLSRSWSVHRLWYGVELKDRNRQHSKVVFTGIPPWSLDIEPTLRLHGL